MKSGRITNDSVAQKSQLDMLARDHIIFDYFTKLIIKNYLPNKTMFASSASKGLISILQNRSNLNDTKEHRIEQHKDAIAVYFQNPKNVGKRLYNIITTQLQRYDENSITTLGFDEEKTRSIVDVLVNNEYLLKIFFKEINKRCHEPSQAIPSLFSLILDTLNLLVRNIDEFKGGDDRYSALVNECKKEIVELINNYLKMQSDTRLKSEITSFNIVLERLDIMRFAVSVPHAEVRKNSRLLAQLSRCKAGMFHLLPKDILIKIASHTAPELPTQDAVKISKTVFTETINRSFSSPNK